MHVYAGTKQLQVLSPRFANSEAKSIQNAFMYDVAFEKTIRSNHLVHLYRKDTSGGDNQRLNQASGFKSASIVSSYEQGSSKLKLQLPPLHGVNMENNVFRANYLLW